MPRTKTIQAILHNPRLPTLPAVAIRVLELTRDENVNFRDVASAIQNDQALSIKIIRTVNSSYFGLSRPCTSINQAIVLLGIEAVKTLVLGFSLVDSIDGSCDYEVGFDYATYWRRSLHSAVAAREIAQAAGTCDPEEAFLGALIQDIGMIALYRAFRDVYIQILDLTHGDHGQLVARERRALEMDHTEVGAAIGEMWRLPPPLIAAIRHHHDDDPSHGPFTNLRRIIALAGRTAKLLESTDTRADDAETNLRPTYHFHHLMREVIGLAPAAVESLLTTVQHGAMELASLFKVDISTPVAIDRVLGEAEDLRVQREMLASGLSTHPPLQQWRNETSGHPSSSDNISRNGPMLGDETNGHWQDARASVSVAADIVSPPIFRQQLRSAFADAESRDGCVGVMVCEITPAAPCQSSEAGGDRQMADFPLSNQIAEEIGSEGVITMSGPGRAVLFIPRADRVVIARLAHTISRHLQQALNCHFAPAKGDDEDNDNSADTPEGAAVKFNIGGAAFDRTSRTTITDEQKLISLAEQALNCAIGAGRRAVRIFNPSQSNERAA